MALSRKLLKGMGLTDEQVETIIEAHTETVDGLKKDIEKYKGDAEKLPGVQKKLNDLEAAGDGGYKEKYEKEHEAFENFKNEQTAKETKKAKENAYRELLKAAGVSEKRIPAIIKVTDLNSVVLEGDTFKDAAKLTESIKTDWADFIESSNTSGAQTDTPPASNPGGDVDPGKMTMQEYEAWLKKNNH